MSEKKIHGTGDRLPLTSHVEERAKRIFHDIDAVKSEEDLDSIISHVFSTICGEYGRQEFFAYVLPAVKNIYGTNYRKAGLRLLNIIDKGAEHKPAEIGTYFKTAIPYEELAYAKKSKEQIVEDIITTINQVILDTKKKYGETYKGIVAAILYGSYARKNFSLNSDLDILYVRKSEHPTEYVPGEKYINYVEDFENSLGRKIRPATDNIYGSVCIGIESDFKILKSKHSLIRGAYIVVSPYPDIKQEIETLMEK